MKKTRRPFLKSSVIIAFVFMLSLTTNINAQGPPGGPTDTNIDTTSDAIPLDGGLSILILGAAAFGVKKIRDNKKRK